MITARSSAVFLEQYFPESRNSERSDSSSSWRLRQEGMTVAEYESTFTSLSRGIRDW